MTSCTKVYAQAIFDVAAARSRSDAVGREIEEVLDALRRHRDLDESLSGPNVPREAKHAILREVFPDAAPETIDFLRLLIDQDRMDLLPEIVAAYREIAYRAAGRTEVEVTSARELTPAEIERIRETARQRFGGQVEIRERTDPALLGGLVVRVGDYVLDGSVRSRIRAVRRTLGETKFRLDVWDGEGEYDEALDAIRPPAGGSGSARPGGEVR